MTDERTEEKLRKLAALEPDQADQSWLLYLSGQGKERELTDNLIDIALFQKLNKDFKEEIHLKPSSRAACEGEYELGDVLYPGPKKFSRFGMRENEWIRHALVCGMAGSGKTTFCQNVLRQLRKHNKRFLVFDPKATYRDLLQLPEFKDLKVYTIGREVSPFHFNPMIPPPGVPAGIWIVQLADIMCHAFFEGAGARDVLVEGLDKVYEECGYYDGSKHTVPTFELVKEKVSKRPTLSGRETLWKSSALRALRALCFRHCLGPVLNCDYKLDFGELLSQDVILELDTLPDDDKTFLTEAIILWLYHYRKQEAGRETFKHLLVIEEAHHILSSGKEKQLGKETIVERVIREIREFGEALMAIDQEPQKISDSMKANSYSKVVFSLANGKDIIDISLCMNLTEEERNALDLLDVGHAVVALKGRVKVPLHVRFPKIEIEKGKVTDERIGSSYEGAV